MSFSYENMLVINDHRCSVNFIIKSATREMDDVFLAAGGTNRLLLKQVLIISH